MFQPSKGPSSGSTDTFREHGQQSTRVVWYVAFCKLLRNTQHAALYSDIYIRTRILLTLLMKYISTPCGWPL